MLRQIPSRSFSSSPALCAMPPCCRGVPAVLSLLFIAVGCAAEGPPEETEAETSASEHTAEFDASPSDGAAFGSQPGTVPKVLHSASGEPVRIEARGTNFLWHFYLLDKGRSPGDESLPSLGPQLHVAAGTALEVHLTSTDYIYTMAAPDGTREIAVPEMIHILRFTPAITGRVEFRTDPLCGLRRFHDDVQGTMQVHDGSQP